VCGLDVVAWLESFRPDRVGSCSSGIGGVSPLESDLHERTDRRNIELGENSESESGPRGGSAVLRSFSNEEKAALADDVVERVESLGIPLQKGSRLKRVSRALRNAAQFTPPRMDLAEHETIQWMGQLLATLMEFHLILERVDFSEPEALAALKLASSGTPMGKGSAHDRARDAQAELMCATILSSAGCRVTWQEPDLFAPDLLGCDSLIAIKRIASHVRAQADRQVSRARKQIVRCGKPGLVVVCASKLLSGSVLRLDPLDVSRDLYRMTARWLDVACRNDPGGDIRGLIGMATTAQYRDGRFEIRGHLTPISRLETAGQARKAEQELEILMSRLRLGLMDAI
jgi:hypothetical protein